MFTSGTYGTSLYNSYSSMYQHKLHMVVFGLVVLLLVVVDQTMP